jgi:glycosyltransferase involved in cell wall biosynthesis
VIELAENGQPSIREDSGIQIHRVTRGNLHWFVSKIPLLGKALALPVREIEYSLAAWRGIRHAGQVDLIEGTETGMLLAALFHKDTPLVIRLHGETYTFHKHTPGMPLSLGIKLSRMLQRFALRRATVLLSPSEAHAREIAQELGANHKSIRIVPNGITVNEVSNPQESRNDATVLYVGRLERVKGVPLFLQAAQRLASEFPSVRFVLAGGSHPTLSRNDIDSMIRSYQLEDKVQFLGHVPRLILIDLFRKSTVCVVPSHYETFGLVALEAMTWGVPVVASRTGALPEIVVDGVTGLLVSTGNHTAFAEAIGRLLRNPAERKRMGMAGRERVLTEFSAENNIALSLRVYEEVTARTNEPRPLNAVQSWN